MKKIGLVAGACAALGAAVISYVAVQPADAAQAASADSAAGLRAAASRAPTSALASESTLAALAAGLVAEGEATIGAYKDGVARDVVVTAPGSAWGVRIAELRAWGVDEAGLARFRAGDAPEVRLADRIEAKGVAAFGLDDVYQPMIDGVSGLFEDVAETQVEGAASPPATAAFDYDVAKLDLGAERLVLDGLTLHAPDADAALADRAPLWRMLAAWASFSRAASYDLAVIEGFAGAMATEQGPDGEKLAQETTFSAAFSGVRNSRRGDIGFLIAESVESRSVLGGGGAQPFAGFTSRLGYGALSIEGMRLAPLLAHLAEGALPPATETDIISLGVSRTRDEFQEYGGARVYAMRESMVDATKFHWLLPTEIRAEAKGGVWDFRGLLELFETAYAAGVAAGSTEGGSAAESAPDAQSLEQIRSFIEALKSTGLDTVPFDADLRYAWAPTDGATALAITVAAEDLGRYHVDLAGGLPDFKRMQAAMDGKSGDAPGASLAALFAERSGLDAVKVHVTDAGALEAGFTLAVELAKLAPEDDQQAAMLRTADPADLRLTAAGMMRLAAPQLQQTAPAAVAMTVAFADFVQKGGMLRIEAAPSDRLTAAEFEALAAVDPGAMIKTLGLTVEHTSPAE